MKLSRGTTLIRGAGNNTLRNITFFAYGNDAVRLVTNEYTKYNTNKIYVYKTTKDLNLMDMSKPGNIMKLANATNNPRSLYKSFAISSNGVVVLRSSKIHHDTEVAKLVCKLGYDGYFAPSLKHRKYANKTFHPEILLCKAGDKVNLNSTMAPDKPLMPAPKKRIRRISNNVEPLSRSLFG